MTPEQKQELLRQIPSITDLLKSGQAAAWLAAHPQGLVTDCLRQAVGALRQAVLEDQAGRCGPAHVTPEVLLASARALLDERVQPAVRRAINATGVILHTGLGRAVFPESVVDSMIPELKGYSTLAVDRKTGERAERDELIEGLLTEITGAEAATVANNNAAATLLVLAGMAAGREVIVSRGQLIEIGGSFRLPEVMSQSGARLVEVGATNRTHLKDYERALSDQTAAILRVHPSNYRIIGFTSEVEPGTLAELAHRRGVLFIDDLGAGALVGLEAFGLPHEPTVAESLAAGADLVLFSGDKLVGAGQAGIVVGKKALVDRLRQHPLMRALRVDKTCLMVLERTLQLFRDPARLKERHPTYRMMSAAIPELAARAQALVAAVAPAAPRLRTAVAEADSYLGSGTLPTQAVPSVVVSVSVEGLSAAELAARLRTDEACVFARIERDLVRLDMRTITDDDARDIAAALRRIAA